MPATIDTDFDFRSDATGPDPDNSSPTLRRYHRLLWSKPLPTGQVFDLVDTHPWTYLYHESHLGEFHLSSDSFLQTFIRWKRTKAIIDQVAPDVRDEFMRIGYTIGGMIIFPCNVVDGRMTINGARGVNAAIADRMDLTLECIRRHYLDEPSPLGDTLARYREFFSLFTDFSGYVEFFLLQDLVNERGGVRFFLPFNDFRTPSVPQTLAEWDTFRLASTELVSARNSRIRAA
jgi:hypothetical protein